MKPKRRGEGDGKKSIKVVLDEEVIRRIDALIPALSTEWYEVKRPDVLRKLILTGLEIEEKRRALEHRTQ